MELYVTKDAYNVLGFDGDPLIIASPATIGETIVQPGDHVTAILSSGLTSAGFGSFEMASGCITYRGRYQHADERGDITYLLFDYPFQRDLFGLINGHKHAFVGWALLEDGNLFYEIRGNNGRVIMPGTVRML
jgi:hypothetical protein